MKKIIVAATALTLGFGAFVLPAAADAEDHGQHVYTQDDPTRFAPAGLSSDEAGARDNARERVYQSVDSRHMQY